MTWAATVSRPWQGLSHSSSAAIVRSSTAARARAARSQEIVVAAGPVHEFPVRSDEFDRLGGAGQVLVVVARAVRASRAGTGHRDVRQRPEIVQRPTLRVYGAAHLRVARAARHSGRACARIDLNRQVELGDRLRFPVKLSAIRLNECPVPTARIRGDAAIRSWSSPTLVGVFGEDARKSILPAQFRNLAVMSTILPNKAVPRRLPREGTLGTALPVNYPCQSPRCKSIAFIFPFATILFPRRSDYSILDSNAAWLCGPAADTATPAPSCLPDH